MPDRKTLARVKRDKLQGKSASTQAGEFVREEMEHVRSGKHGASSVKQIIAIGLSKARRAGIPIKPVPKGDNKMETKTVAPKKPKARKTAAKTTKKTVKRKTGTTAKRRSPAKKATTAKKTVAAKRPVKRKTATKKAVGTKRRATTAKKTVKARAKTVRKSKK